MYVNLIFNTRAHIYRRDWLGEGGGARVAVCLVKTFEIRPIAIEVHQSTLYWSIPKLRAIEITNAFKDITSRTG